MIAAALLIQAAVPAPVAVGANVQLACTVAGPRFAPATMAVDLQTKKPGSAGVEADAAAPFAHVGATSDAVAWPTGAPAAVAFVMATGAAQYRVELLFAGDRAAGNARVRVVALDGPVRFAQGYCTGRTGKRLTPKALVRMPFDATLLPRPGGPTQLRPIPAGLTEGTCRLVAPDRGIHTLTYAVTVAHDNEAGVAYRFGDTQLTGVALAAGTGLRFHLVTPTDRSVTMTQALDTDPIIYVQTSYERSGDWIELTRAGATLASGECGPAPAAILLPVQETAVQ